MVTIPANAVLLFSTVADASRAARLHDAGCPMVNTAKRGGKVKRIPREGSSSTSELTLAEVAYTVEDLNERNFPVKFCKCLKKARVETRVSTCGPGKHDYDEAAGNTVCEKCGARTGDGT